MNEGSLSGLLSDDEILDFREAISKPAARCIRLRPSREGHERLPMAVEGVPWFERGRLLVDSRIRPSQLLQFAAADYYIQDAGSLLALAVLDAQPHESICDLCAAPGGKASGIGETLESGGFLLANEPIGSRAAVLRFALSRTGNPRYAITQQDPDEIAIRFAGLFDAVLVDAPCSGQTMVGRGKRDRNAFDPKQVEHCVRRQQRILLAACKLLKAGGRLIYSTCTFAIEENEAQIRFLQSCFPNAWEPIRLPNLDRWASPIEPGCYRLWPHRDPTAGAFAAGLRLKQTIAHEIAKSDIRGASHGPPKRSNPPRLKVSAIDFDSEATFGQIHHMRIKATGNGDVFGVADDIPEEFGLPLTEREWPKIATLQADVWKPEYALAMLDSEWFQPTRRMEFADRDARKYMLGEAIYLESCSEVAEIRSSEMQNPIRQQPWAAITWHQKPLGWAKFAANRVNNHLPKLAILPIRF